MRDIQNPIVLIPKGFDCTKAWKECSDEVERCGGLVDDDGAPNWRAAFSADPGCCHCPSCKTNYWSWGILVKCRLCEFVFPTNAWPMYSWGAQQNRKPKEITQKLSKLHEKRMAHPYYRYGVEHPSKDTWEQFNSLPWDEIFKDGYLPTDEFIDGAYRP